MRSKYRTRLAKLIVDAIFDLTAVVFQILLILGQGARSVRKVFSIKTRTFYSCRGTPRGKVLTSYRLPTTKFYVFTSCQRRYPPKYTRCYPCKAEHGFSPRGRRGTPAKRGCAAPSKSKTGSSISSSTPPACPWRWGLGSLLLLRGPSLTAPR